MIPKITLDGGLLRASVLLPAVRVLRAWEAAGKVELFESDRAKAAPTAAWAPPSPSRGRFPARARVARKSSASGGASFQSFSSVLFPSRDPQRLNIGEVNDVAHLLRHHSLGHSLFVTTNVDNFIADGKREKLLAAFKLIVLTPDEAVQVLEQSDGLVSATAGGAR